MDVFSHNGVVKPTGIESDLLFNIEYTYGFGVYETLRVEKNNARYADQHCDRLLQSAHIIDLEHNFTKVQLIEFIQDLVDKVNSPAFNLKILLIGGKTANDSQLYMLPINPRFPDRKLYKDGAHAIIVDYERYLPQAKTLNMLPSYLAYRKAHKAGAYDALLRSPRGELLEGTMTNLFGVIGSTIYTAPDSRVLGGVTRSHVIECAQQNGFEVVQRVISSNDLANYDSLFLTSTSTRIMPLRSVENQSFSIPENIRKLMNAFKQY